MERSQYSSAYKDDSETLKLSWLHTLDTGSKAEQYKVHERSPSERCFCRNRPMYDFAYASSRSHSSNAVLRKKPFNHQDFV